MKRPCRVEGWARGCLVVAGTASKRYVRVPDLVSDLLSNDLILQRQEPR